MRHSRKAISLFAIIVVLCWILVLLSLLARFGALGMLGWIAATVVFFMGAHVAYRYFCEAIVELDSLPCAHCSKPGLINVELQGKQRTWHCQCGARYAIRGPVVYVQSEETGLAAYQRWKWWGHGRWRPA